MAGPNAAALDETSSKRKEAHRREDSIRGTDSAKRSLGGEDNESAQEDSDKARHSKKAKTDEHHTGSGAAAVAEDANAAQAPDASYRLPPYSSPSHRTSGAAHGLLLSKTSLHAPSAVRTGTNTYIKTTTSLPANTTTPADEYDPELDHDAHPGFARDAAEDRNQIEPSTNSATPKTLTRARSANFSRRPQHKLHSDPVVNEIMNRSGAFMTPDKLVPAHDELTKQWLRDGNYNIPRPRAPKPIAELDQTTPYRQLHYDTNNIDSVRQALHVVVKDIRSFMQDPRHFDRNGEPGQKESLRLREAQVVKIDLDRCHHTLKRREQIEEGERKFARELAEYRAEDDRQKYLDERWERKWPNHLNRPMTPPHPMVLEAEEANRNAREAAEKNPWARRQYSKEVEEKKQAAKKRDEEQHERGKDFAKGYPAPSGPSGSSRRIRSSKKKNQVEGEHKGTTSQRPHQTEMQHGGTVQQQPGHAALDTEGRLRTEKEGKQAASKPVSADEGARKGDGGPAGSPTTIPGKPAQRQKKARKRPQAPAVQPVKKTPFKALMDEAQGMK